MGQLFSSPKKSGEEKQLRAREAKQQQPEANQQQPEENKEGRKQPSKKAAEKNLNFIVMGSAGSGKSACCRRFLGINEAESETIGMDLYEKKISCAALPGIELKITIIEDANDSLNRTRSSVDPFGLVDVILVLCSVADFRGWRAHDYWVDRASEVKHMRVHPIENVPIVLVPSMCDKEWLVDAQEFKDYASAHAMLYCPISARTNSGIDDLFLGSCLRAARVKKWMASAHKSECQFCGCEFGVFSWRYLCNHCARGFCRSHVALQKDAWVCDWCSSGLCAAGFLKGEVVDTHGDALKLIKNLPIFTFEQEKIARGTSAHIHLGRLTRDGELVAIKQYLLCDGNLEAEILTQYGAQNPGGHESMLELRAQDLALSFIATKYYPLGTLHHILSSTVNPALESSQNRLQIAAQAAEAMAFLHSKGYLHLDLKADSILVSTLTPERVAIRLFDFGSAMQLQANIKNKSPIGTPTHIAPEMWQRNFGPQADVYSFGVLLTELFAATPDGWKSPLFPFAHYPGSSLAESKSDEARCLSFVDQVKRQVCLKTGYLRPKLPVGPCVPQGLSELIDSCLRPDPGSRPNFTQLSLVLRLMLTTTDSLMSILKSISPTSTSDRSSIDRPSPNVPDQAVLAPVTANVTSNRIQAQNSQQRGLGHESLRAKLLAAETSICDMYHARLPQDYKTERMLAVAERASTVVSRLLFLDWNDTIHACGFLKELGEGKDEQISSQPALDKSPEGLIGVAMIAQPELFAKLEVLMKGKVDKIKMGPVKELARLNAKLSGQAPGMCFDLNRATILCETAEEFSYILMKLPLVFGRVLKLKNKFDIEWVDISTPPCLFYQVELISPELASLLEPHSTWVVEIQVTTPEFYQTKECCHPIYEVTRAKNHPLPKCPVCKNC